MGQRTGGCRQIDPLIPLECTPEERASSLIAANDVKFQALWICLIVLVGFASLWSYEAVREHSRNIAPSTEVSEMTRKPHVMTPGTTSGDTSPTREDVESVPDYTRDNIPGQVSEIREKMKTELGSDELPPECQRVKELLRKEMMPEWMSYVAWRESRCQHDAKRLLTSTGDQSFGYFQINTLDNLWVEVQRACGINERHVLLVEETNVSCAAELYRRYGYKPWHSGVYFTAP